MLCQISILVAAVPSCFFPSNEASCNVLFQSLCSIVSSSITSFATTLCSWSAYTGTALVGVPPYAKKVQRDSRSETHERPAYLLHNMLPRGGLVGIGRHRICQSIVMGHENRLESVIGWLEGLWDLRRRFGSNWLRAKEGQRHSLRNTAAQNPSNDRICCSFGYSPSSLPDSQGLLGTDTHHERRLACRWCICLGRAGKGLERARLRLSIQNPGLLTASFPTVLMAHERLRL